MQLDPTWLDPSVFLLHASPVSFTVGLFLGHFLVVTCSSPQLILLSSYKKKLFTLQSHTIEVLKIVSLALLGPYTYP
jgi:hypothetical protein